MYRFDAFLVLQICATGFALLFGGRAERGVGTLQLGAFGLTIATRRDAMTLFHSVEISRLMVDAALLAALIVVAARYDRRWTIWMAAFQAMTVAAHVARAVSPDIPPYAYRTMAVWGSWPMVLLLIGATAQHLFRGPATIADTSWSSSLSRWVRMKLGGRRLH